MNDQRSELKEAVRSLNRAARSIRGPHPAVEELTEYRSGGLSQEVRERIRDHLTLCRECQQLVLDFGALSDLASEGRELTAADVDQQWGRLARRLRSAPPQDSVAVVSSRPRFAWALAAALATAVVGLSVWVQALRHQNRELIRPQINAHLGDLFADGDRLRESGQFERVVVPPEADQVVLILNLNRPETFSDYRVEILDSLAEDARVRWRRDGLRRGSEGNFVLTLRRGFLPPGRYRIRILGLEAEQEHLLASYGFEVIDASSIDPAG